MTVPRSKRSISGMVTGIRPISRPGVGIAVQRGGDGQVHAGEQAQGAPAVPGPSADHLTGVQANLLRELVILFDFPAGLRDGDQPGQRHRPGVQHR